MEEEEHVDQNEGNIFEEKDGKYKTMVIPMVMMLLMTMMTTINRLLLPSRQSFMRKLKTV